MAQATGTPGPDPYFTEPAKRELFLAAIRAGASLDAALKAIGTNYSTWQHWKRQADAGQEPYVEFINAVRAEEAALERRLTQTWLDIIEAARVTADHRPLMEFMSRRFKENWSPTYTAKVEASVELTNIDAEDVRRRLLRDATTGPSAPEDSGSGPGPGPD